MAARPVFLFAAGWRSGSTLLQRAVTAGREVLVWGEAGGALGCLAEAAERYRQMLGAGDERYRFGFGGNGAQQYRDFAAAGVGGVRRWVASMNPPEATLLEACRGYFDVLYGAPARSLGYPEWGVKEVQSGLATARFLRELYPQGRFVFLVRDPLACLVSIKRRDWIDASGRRDPLGHFARHWARLAGEFRAADFGQLLRFEALVTDPQVLQDTLAAFDLPAPPADFIAGSRADWEAHHQRPLTWRERRRALAIVGEEMARYGYSA